jgi:hypothetical protein
MAELLLDPKIRFWVFLPIMAITFLVGIIKHYLFIFLTNEKIAEKQQIMDRYIHFAINFVIKNYFRLFYLKSSNYSKSIVERKWKILT